MPKVPNIDITCCRLCNWGLRASWMAQELLSTFAEEIGELKRLTRDHIAPLAVTPSRR